MRPNRRPGTRCAGSGWSLFSPLWVFETGLAPLASGRRPKLTCSSGRLRVAVVRTLAGAGAFVTMSERTEATSATTRTTARQTRIAPEPRPGRHSFISCVSTAKRWGLTPRLSCHLASSITLGVRQADLRRCVRVGKAGPRALPRTRTAEGRADQRGLCPTTSTAAGIRPLTRSPLTSPGLYSHAKRSSLRYLALGSSLRESGATYPRRAVRTAARSLSRSSKCLAVRPDPALIPHNV